MITYLSGNLVEKHPTRLVLDVNGVGYEVFIPLSSYDRLPTKGSECMVMTYDYIREDTHSLFGFMTDEERSMFVLLMGISGIGPKLALSALSGLTVKELRGAIMEGNYKRLSSISGVGKKVAERMVVELRDKIGVGDALESISGSDQSEENITMRDAVLALVSLGYKRDPAERMVNDVIKRASGESLTVEDVIKKALGG